MSLGRLTPSKPPGEGLQVTNLMFIEKCTDVFKGTFFLYKKRVEGRGLRGRIFSWRNLSWEERISMKEAQDFLILFKKKQ